MINETALPQVQQQEGLAERGVTQSALLKRSSSVDGVCDVALTCRDLFGARVDFGKEL